MTTAFAPDDYSQQPADSNGGLPTTDADNVARFLQMHGNNVRYSHALRQWFLWDGRRWELDQAGRIRRLVKETARSIRKEASRAADETAARSLEKWADRSESSNRMTALVRLVRIESSVSIMAERFNAAPWLVNCENGTVDLQTGEMRAFSRSDWLTKIHPVVYPNTAALRCPNRRLAFVEQNFPDAPAAIDFARDLAGQALRDEIAALYDHFATKIGSCGFSPASDRVFIPSPVVAEWMSEADGERYSTIGAGRQLAASIARQPKVNRRLTPTNKRGHGRGWLWVGPNASSTAPIRYILRESEPLTTEETPQ